MKFCVRCCVSADESLFYIMCVNRDREVIAVDFGNLHCIFCLHSPNTYHFSRLTDLSSPGFLAVIRFVLIHNSFTTIFIIVNVIT